MNVLNLNGPWSRQSCQKACIVTSRILNESLGGLYMFDHSLGAAEMRQQMMMLSRKIVGG